MEKEWMKEKTIIRFNDLARRMKGNEYAKLVLHRMVKQKKLKRIAKGVYTLSNDIFSIASNIHYPSYISFLSASYLLGFTETIPRKICVVTAKRYKRIDFEGYDIEFIKMREMWGYHKEEDTEPKFIVDTEKLMIDAFLKPKKMGNFEEIENVFKRAEKIDLERIKEYLKKINSNKIYKQVGHLLQKYQNIDISKYFKLDNNYYPLNPFQKGRKISKKWRLFI